MHSRNKFIGLAIKKLWGNFPAQIFQQAVVAHTKRILRYAKALVNQIFAELWPSRMVIIARHRRLFASAMARRTIKAKSTPWGQVMHGAGAQKSTVFALVTR
ncbi:MAG: hypothetical protein ACLQMO_09105 [Acidobacteriaceae bacterium]